MQNDPARPLSLGFGCAKNSFKSLASSTIRFTVWSPQLVSQLMAPQVRVVLALNSWSALGTPPIAPSWTSTTYRRRFQGTPRRIQPPSA